MTGDDKGVGLSRGDRRRSMARGEERKKGEAQFRSLRSATASVKCQNQEALSVDQEERKMSGSLCNYGISWADQRTLPGDTQNLNVGRFRSGGE